jgi:hypothetical protein
MRVRDFMVDRLPVVVWPVIRRRCRHDAAAHGQSGPPVTARAAVGDQQLLKNSVHDNDDDDDEDDDDAQAELGAGSDYQNPNAGVYVADSFGTEDTRFGDRRWHGNIFSHQRLPVIEVTDAEAEGDVTLYGCDCIIARGSQDSHPPILMIPCCRDCSSFHPDAS